MNRYRPACAGAIAALFALALFLLPASPGAAAPPRHADMSKRQRMHHYQSEHDSRLRRHAHLTPAQKHARMVRYGREHQTRMHRHRAQVRAQGRHEQ